ncbi:MAG: hypothetical protein ETSY2_44925 [Candidatus Entotheonella gemina]|uniref:Uncharacterized protein n=1 Tax=Candidatus Entotheonella gemina TaxID=1429439 RepID=W4LHR7_9BACT|nr:MAG: hypothetical protein ETSY2_44925 [Candidatus Entotheonella gemina]
MLKEQLSIIAAKLLHSADALDMPVPVFHQVRAVPSEILDEIVSFPV